MLAAAVRGECDVLVTSNVRDCPDQVVEAFDLSVATVDDAIIFVVDSFPDAMAEIVDRLLAPLRNPPMTRDMFTDRLSLRAPMGATVLGAALGIETYVRIRENARDAPNKAGPIVALSRLVDAIEHGRADEVVEMVAPELAEEITGSKSPDRHELCAKLRVLLDDVKLGSVEIGKLRTSDVRAWDAGLLTAGVGPVTVAKAYRLLRAMLNTALQDGLIGKNPCNIKGAGVEHSPERPIVTVAEVHALADAVGDKFRALVLLGAYGGLRFGELLPLRRDRLDLVEQVVHVRETLHELVGGGVVLGPPKSAPGWRTVAMPPHLVPVLAEHLDRFVAPGAEAFVFTGHKGGWLRKSQWNMQWHAARERVGVPHINFHDYADSFA